MSIAVRDVSKQFGRFTALGSVSVDIPEGELLALLGPSGSGKTTLLRVIAGLEHPDCGSVRLADDDITHRSARDRNVGFVFQHYALFRHMTVFENVAFGPRVRKWREEQVRMRVEELLALVRLGELGGRYPSELSGGQRQRVALARALAVRPRVLLLDEPFGALDAKVRAELRVWLRRLHDEYPVTTVFVTHDQEEAFEVADRVVIMNQGRVEQEGTPAEVFEHPANPFVMDFLGNVNKLPVRVEGGRALLGDQGSVELPAKLFGGNGNGRASAYIRPHELDISRAAVGGHSLLGRIVHINPAGSVVKVRLFAEDFGLMINVDIAPDRYKALALKPNETVSVTPKSAKIFETDYSI